MVAPPHYQIQVQFTSTVFVGDSTNIDLRSPKECGLENEAQLIAEMYNEVLNHLFAPGAEQQPGNRRLQYAFAAACAGLSRAEWDAMSTKDKESLRCKYSQSYRTPNHQFALEPPALVVYIGPKRICGNSGSSSVSSSPSVQALSQATGNSEDGEEFTAWDKAWDEAVNTSELPCTWAWHVCSDGARVIFLSGFFALWHGLYKTTKLSDLIIMTTFLKLVLFHELCHATRSVLYGSTHLTPEKCVDAGGPSPTHEDGRMIGDAGRLAEELAFGFVVGLYMDNCRLTLYACDQEDPLDTAYRLTPSVYTDLFSVSQATPLPAAQHLDTPAIEIPFQERLKNLYCNQVLAPSVRLSCAIPSPLYTFPLRAVDGLEAVPEPLGRSLFLKDRGWKSCIG